MSDNVALVGGYVVVAAIVVQWAVVVRDRLAWLVVLHTLAMAAVIAAWFHKGYAGPAFVNMAWLVLALAWYAAGRRARHGRVAGRALDEPVPLDGLADHADTADDADDAPDDGP